MNGKSGHPSKHEVKSKTENPKHTHSSKHHGALPGPAPHHEAEISIYGASKTKHGHKKSHDLTRSHEKIDKVMNAQSKQLEYEYSHQKDSHQTPMDDLIGLEHAEYL